MKKVVIIGGGISGCFAAIRIKEKRPDYKVSIYEQNDKLLKKIYATGNGKCNFANKGFLHDKYTNEEFVEPILRSFGAEDIVKYFEHIGIKTKAVGDLLYPYSESAETVANFLLKKIEELNIDVHLNSNVKVYGGGLFMTENYGDEYDAIIISVGGKSSPQLGSNGGFHQVLIDKGYSFKECSPSLCPIKTKENTKMVDGLRSKVSASLYDGNKLIHEEEGELLFKKDGLSGMVIFNLTHFINQLPNKNNVKIHIDFAKGLSGDVESLVNPKIAKYLLDNKLDVHNTVFTFKDFYGYENSQVTSGGLKVSELNPNLSSKREPNVYFIGEVVDVDAVCGGYNIMWALASAEEVSRTI